jgi:type IV secretory pathway VirB4 component
MNPQNQNNAAQPGQNQPAGQPQSPAAQLPNDPQQKKNPINPNSTQNHLKIAEIRDGIVIMEDGSFRAVVMAKSINFDLMSINEQESVEYSFQSFLNSLYYPVQIFIRSQKIDMADYITKLDKIRTEHDNMLLALLMEDYIDFISDLAEQTNIMNKTFYVIVPFLPHEESQQKNLNIARESKSMISGLGSIFTNTQTRVIIDEKKLEEAKTELRNRVQAVMSGLNECGVKSIPLDTQELIELYYDAYNPDTATRQKIKNFDELTSPMVTKGTGQAPQPNLDKELET